MLSSHERSRVRISLLSAVAFACASTLLAPTAHARRDPSIPVSPGSQWVDAARAVNWVQLGGIVAAVPSLTTNIVITDFLARGERVPIGWSVTGTVLWAGHVGLAVSALGVNGLAVNANPLLNVVAPGVYTAVSLASLALSAYGITQAPRSGARGIHAMVVPTTVIDSSGASAPAVGVVGAF